MSAFLVAVLWPRKLRQQNEEQDKASVRSDVFLVKRWNPWKLIYNRVFLLEKALLFENLFHDETTQKYLKYYTFAKNNCCAI